MTRKLKALGLALVAVFAMSAVAASAASAVEFHGGAEPTKINATGVGNQTLSANGVNVVCSTSSFTSGNVAQTTSSITITPTYSNCKVAGLFTAHVNFTSCDYTFNASGTVDLGCTTEGDTVDITATFFGSSVCTIKISEGTFAEAATYDNVTEGGKKHVTVTANAKGITYAETGGECGIGSGTNGTYTGNATVKGQNGAGEQVDVWVE